MVNHSCLAVAVNPKAIMVLFFPGQGPRLQRTGSRGLVRCLPWEPVPIPGGRSASAPESGAPALARGQPLRLNLTAAQRCRKCCGPRQSVGAASAAVRDSSAANATFWTPRFAWEDRNRVYPRNKKQRLAPSIMASPTRICGRVGAAASA